MQGVDSSVPSGKFKGISESDSNFAQVVFDRLVSIEKIVTKLAAEEDAEP